MDKIGEVFYAAFQQDFVELDISSAMALCIQKPVSMSAFSKYHVKASCNTSVYHNLKDLHHLIKIVKSMLYWKGGYPI